jgi:hypothetical protein
MTVRLHQSLQEAQQYQEHLFDEEDRRLIPIERSEYMERIRSAEQVATTNKKIQNIVSAIIAFFLGYFFLTWPRAAHLFQNAPSLAREHPFLVALIPATGAFSLD